MCLAHINVCYFRTIRETTSLGYTMNSAMCAQLVIKYCRYLLLRSSHLYSVVQSLKFAPKDKILGTKMSKDKQSKKAQIYLKTMSLDKNHFAEGIFV